MNTATTVARRRARVPCGTHVLEKSSASASFPETARAEQMMNTNGLPARGGLRKRGPYFDRMNEEGERLEEKRSYNRRRRDGSFEILDDGRRMRFTNPTSPVEFARKVNAMLDLVARELTRRPKPPARRAVARAPRRARVRALVARTAAPSSDPPAGPPSRERTARRGGAR